MLIFECEQRSPEWFAARKGVPTASQFDRILTPATGKPSSSQRDYICELIADSLSHAAAGPKDEYISPAMRNGIITEPEARNWYEMECGLDCRRVGFCVTDCGRFGMSPDALVGEDGGLELKCPTGKVHASYLLGGVLPNEHKVQVHGELLVSGRRWWDFVSYHPGMEPFRIRVTPDGYTELLRKELENFWTAYQNALLKIRGDAPEAKQ